MITCPECGCTHVNERDEREYFMYKIGDGAVQLSAKVIVLYCHECPFEWTDDRAEKTRDKAVEKHSWREEMKTRSTRPAHQSPPRPG